jgi:hypothetical protein
MAGYTWVIDGHEEYQVGSNRKPTGWRRPLTGRGDEYKINLFTGRKTGEKRKRTSLIPARVLDLMKGR